MKLTALHRAQRLCTHSVNPAVGRKSSTDLKAPALSINRSAFIRSGAAAATAIFNFGGVNGFASAAMMTAESVLQNPDWPDKFPFPPEALSRYDESDDQLFYDYPRFVTHIDDAAIQSLTKFYAETFPASGNPNVAILDTCSSWISHYPEGYTAGRISGLGMNEEELQRNKILTDYTVKDLNKDPVLPYESNSFDVITNAVSVDYLTKPMEVFKEMHRCLKPGGIAIMSFSNRCFPTKAVAVWTQTGDLDHIYIVGSYFHYTGGFEPPQAKDITEKQGMFGPKTDPMYVVFARKQNVDF